MAFRLLFSNYLLVYLTVKSFPYVTGSFTNYLVLTEDIVAQPDDAPCPSEIFTVYMQPGLRLLVQNKSHCNKLKSVPPRPHTANLGKIPTKISQTFRAQEALLIKGGTHSRHSTRFCRWKCHILRTASITMNNLSLHFSVVLCLLLADMHACLLACLLVCLMALLRLCFSN